MYSTPKNITRNISCRVSDWWLVAGKNIFSIYHPEQGDVRGLRVVGDRGENTEYQAGENREETKEKMRDETTIM